MIKPDWSALVVGGGVAGATTALLLAKQTGKVCVIDQRVPQFEDKASNRVVAISLGSERILKHIGIWPALPADRLAPYDQMVVDAKGQRLTFRADEHGLPHLGTLIEIPLLEKVLWEAMAHHPNIEIKAPVQWHDFEDTPSGIRLRLLDEAGDVQATLSACVLIGADGARSRIRQQAGIDHTWWDYNQQALIGPVRTEKPNDGLAWQRFTELGPLALLPLPDGRSSIVWSIPSAEADRLGGASDEALTDTLIEAINEAIENEGEPSPLGQVLSIEAPQWMPLKRQRASLLAQQSVALVGDAAHAVHPLAGQGLNLGLADAAALAQCLEGQLDSSQAKIHQALSRYGRWRLSQSTLASGGIHWINELQRLPMGLGRWGLGVSFLAANTLWPIRQTLIEHASGIDKDSPLIARLA